jgi:mono/diheme cytochrome c family protein
MSACIPHCHPCAVFSKETALMTKPRRMSAAHLFLALLALGLPVALDAAQAAESEGQALLAKNCGRCHSIEANGESPLPQAPPLREIYLKYPIDQLEEGFAEGMGSRHRDMPQIQFSDDQVAAILTYLGSITGVDPTKRAPAVIPDETPP